MLWMPSSGSLSSAFEACKHHLTFVGKACKHYLWSQILFMSSQGLGPGVRVHMQNSIRSWYISCTFNSIPRTSISQWCLWCSSECSNLDHWEPFPQEVSLHKWAQLICGKEGQRVFPIDHGCIGHFRYQTGEWIIKLIIQSNTFSQFSKEEIMGCIRSDGIPATIRNIVPSYLTSLWALKKSSWSSTVMWYLCCLCGIVAHGISHWNAFQLEAVAKKVIFSLKLASMRITTKSELLQDDVNFMTSQAEGDEPASWRGTDTEETDLSVFQIFSLALARSVLFIFRKTQPTPQAHF